MYLIQMSHKEGDRRLLDAEFKTEQLNRAQAYVGNGFETYEKATRGTIFLMRSRENGGLLEVGRATRKDYREGRMYDVLKAGK